MQQLDLAFDSAGTMTPKPIVCRVIAPDTIDERTGAMLFVHGWGGNRFQYEAMMKGFVLDCDE